MKPRVVLTPAEFKKCVELVLIHDVSCDRLARYVSVSSGAFSAWFMGKSRQKEFSAAVTELGLDVFDVVTSRRHVMGEKIKDIQAIKKLANSVGLRPRKTDPV